MSVRLLVSPDTRLGAAALERNEAAVGGEGRDSWKCRDRLLAPEDVTLSRSIAPVWRSYTKTSAQPLVSPGTRLVASLWKATKRPSAETEGKVENASASAPEGPDADADGGAAFRSRRKMSATPLVSPGTRLVASLEKASSEASAEMEKGPAVSSASAPSQARLMRVVC